MKKKKGEEVKAVESAAVETVDISKPESVTSPTGVALSGALKSEATYENEHAISLVIRDHERPDVTMTGYWDGNLLKAAMRAIERKYDEVRKHATVYAMKQSQANV